MNTFSLHDDQALETFFREQRLDPQRLKRFRFLRDAQRRPVEQVLAELPAAAGDALREQFRIPWLQLEQRHDSQLDGSSKLVFRTPDDARLETVVIRAAGGRTSLCVSSQVGCAARCRFCATARMGLVRNLEAHEVLAQVAQANDLLRDEGRQVRNVVFMGMGEPFHNEPALYEALERLVDVRRFGFSPRKLLVSTVGIPDSMVRFARTFPLIGLALSLHSTLPEQREALIPLARRYPLEELRQAIQEVNACQRRPLMIEYLLVADYNDQLDDAARLAEFLQGLHVYINLIPYNPIDAGPVGWTATPRDQRDRFAGVLREQGFATAIRYSHGADIGAACGQLVQAQPVR